MVSSSLMSSRAPTSSQVTSGTVAKPSLLADGCMLAREAWKSDIRMDKLASVSSDRVSVFFRRCSRFLRSASWKEHVSLQRSTLQRTTPELRSDMKLRHHQAGRMEPGGMEATTWDLEVALQVLNQNFKEKTCGWGQVGSPPAPFLDYIQRKCVSGWFWLVPRAFTNQRYPSDFTTNLLASSFSQRLPRLKGSPGDGRRNIWP